MLKIDNRNYLVSSAEFWGIFKVFNATVGGRVSQGAWIWRVAIGGEHAIGVRLVSLGDCGFRFWYIADFCEKNWGKNVKRYLKRVPLLFTYLILRHLKLVAQPIVRESLQPDHSQTFWRGRNPWKNQVFDYYVIARVWNASIYVPIRIIHQVQSVEDVVQLVWAQTSLKKVEN